MPAAVGSGVEVCCEFYTQGGCLKKNRQLEHTTILPTDPRFLIMHFQLEQLRVEPSKTAPIAASCIVAHRSSESKFEETAGILCVFKKCICMADGTFAQVQTRGSAQRPSGVEPHSPDRRDSQARTGLGSTHHVCNATGCLLGLIRLLVFAPSAYNVVPTSSGGGFIQMVTDASTLYKISAAQQSLLAHILKGQKKATVESIHTAFARRWGGRSVPHQPPDRSEWVLTCFFGPPLIYQPLMRNAR